MKLALTALISFIAHNALANIYTCTSAMTEPTIIVEISGENSKFKYKPEGGRELTLNLGQTNFTYANNWATDRLYMNFHPAWGESTVHIYGRITEEPNGTIFDIYLSGMAAQGPAVIALLTNYSCIKEQH